MCLSHLHMICWFLFGSRQITLHRRISYMREIQRPLSSICYLWILYLLFHNAVIENRMDFGSRISLFFILHSLFTVRVDIVWKALFRENKLQKAMRTLVYMAKYIYFVPSNWHMSINNSSYNEVLSIYRVVICRVEVQYT